MGSMDRPMLLSPERIARTIILHCAYEYLLMTFQITTTIHVQTLSLLVLSYPYLPGFEIPSLRRNDSCIYFLRTATPFLFFINTKQSAWRFGGIIVVDTLHASHSLHESSPSAIWSRFEGLFFSLGHWYEGNYACHVWILYNEKKHKEEWDGGICA